MKLYAIFYFVIQIYIYKMGVDYEKCDGCGECLNTQCFSACFCCEDKDLCYDCTPERNCVDTKEENYMCDRCLQNDTDEDIKSGAKNYGVKNVSKILKYVKKRRKDYFTKELKQKQLQEKIYKCNNEINKLQSELLKYENEIKKL
jgi:hypothetical protein